MSSLGFPLNAELLLHSHCIAAPMPRMDAPAVRESVEFLLTEGMIELYLPDGPDRYRTTDKGRFFIEHLMAVQFPVQRWEIPA
jgi:hypothetical protein